MQLWVWHYLSDLLDRVCRPHCWFVSNKSNFVPNNSIQCCWMLLNSTKSLNCKILTLKRCSKMSPHGLKGCWRWRKVWTRGCKTLTHCKKMAKRDGWNAILLSAVICFWMRINHWSAKYSPWNAARRCELVVWKAAKDAEDGETWLRGCKTLTRC